MTRRWVAVRDNFRALRQDKRGSAAIEFALIVGFLATGILNVFDIVYYIYQRMEVENSAQMGVQAAWKACDQTMLPATTNCTGLTTAVTNAIHSTSLGTAVSFQPGSPSEGYYCLNSLNALQYVSSVSSKPADCSVAGMPSLQPADYIQVQVTYSYAPMFPGITVMSAGSITKTTLMRLG